MTALFAFAAIVFLITTCWLWYKYSLVRDDNDYLTDKTRRLEDENKVMRDNDAMLSIEEKAKAYDRLPHTSFDECGDPIDSKWRL